MLVGQLYPATVRAPFLAKLCLSGYPVVLFLNLLLLLVKHLSHY